MSAITAPAPRIVVAGGHSAGHIEPAMNFADALRALDPSAEITALGTERGLDTTLIPARGYPLELIPPVPLPRKPGKALLQTPAKLAASVSATAQVLRRTHAEAVVGFGGYVAMPAYLAARQARLPIIVHEANARAGVANRLAARLTTHVFTAMSSTTLAHSAAIGMPLRPSIGELDRAALRAQARSLFGLAPDGPVLMVTGGSQGAQAINAALQAAAPMLTDARIGVLHIVGPKNTVEVPADSDPPYVVVPYVDEMAYAYAASDFVICRSGAMTCAELAAVGLPAAYVPLPLRGGEQRLNAVDTVRAGGGLLVDNADLTAEWIMANVVPVLTDPVRLEKMSTAARTTGNRDAAKVLAERVLLVVAEHRRLGRRADRKTK